MVILGIDTSSSFLNLCLWEKDKIKESYSINGGLTHSEQLIPQIINLLKKSDKNIKDIDKIVCTIGPGSFTGIRIGVSTANALAMSLGAEIVGISTLEALSHSSKIENGIIVSTMDAQRDSYYTLWTRIENGKLINFTSEEVQTKNDIINISKKYGEINILGDGSRLWKDLPKNILDVGVNTVNPEILCILGSDIQYKGKYIEPVYIRKSQAEVEYELRKSKNNKF